MSKKQKHVRERERNKRKKMYKKQDGTRTQTDKKLMKGGMTDEREG